MSFSTSAPRIPRLLGAPFRFLAIGFITAYRFVTSGLAPRCRFYPSCSAYAETAIRTHGVTKGLALAVWRVLRCNPFNIGGVDHVPARATSRPRGLEYENVIHAAGGGVSK